MKKAKPVTERVLAEFAKGRSLTPAQITSRFNVANPHDVIYNLRKRGNNIVTEEVKRGNQTVTRYSLAS